MKKVKPRKVVAKRKSKTNAEIRAKRITSETKQRRLIQAQKGKEEMSRFTWSELNTFHAEASSLFAIAEPVRQACVDQVLIEKLRAAGRLNKFSSLAKTFLNDLTNFVNSLNAIYDLHKDKTADIDIVDINSDEYVADAQLGMQISLQYRDWIDAFQTTVIDGIALDIMAIIETADLTDEELKTNEPA